jgi:hypothetical protein
MQKIIEKRLREWGVEDKISYLIGQDNKGNVHSMCNPIKNIKKISELSQLIASDIKSEWKVVAIGRIKNAEFGFCNKLTINFKNLPDKLGIGLMESGKKYEIAVRILDETKE